MAGLTVPVFLALRKFLRRKTLRGLKQKESEVSKVELVTLAARAACFFLCLHPFDML